MKRFILSIAAAAVALGASAPASAQALVDDINRQRRSAYAEIARKNGTDVAAVAALAGKKLVKRTPEGHYFRNAQGFWVKR